jgi:hypothetical protein
MTDGILVTHTLELDWNLVEKICKTTTNEKIEHFKIDYF